MYLTFSDLLDYALAYLGGDAGRSNSDRARRAVQAAYQDLPGRHPWLFYLTHGRIVTNASYNTGTVVYDHTGGTSERLMTLTGGTWPDWAASGTVLIGDVPYEVDARLSDTEITLTSTANPGADLAATAYTLYRDQYPVPSDMLTNYEVVVDAVARKLMYRRAAEWSQLRRFHLGPAKPDFFSFAGDGTTGLLMLFWPPPDAAYSIDFLYKRAPRALAIDRKEAGTASIASGSATVTGTGSSFSSSMVGSVIRLSDSATVSPTGAGGNDPATFEGVIDSVASATSLTLTANAATTLTGVKYVISDPADIEQSTMQRLLYRLIERQCRMMTRMKELPEEAREFQVALAEAREMDSRYSGRQVAGAEGPYHRRLADYPVGTEFQ